MFEHIQAGPSDPMFWLKKRADSDTSPEKVDVGVGIYRNEQGRYQELEVVREAKRRLEKLDLGHDYEVTTGEPEFLRLAAEVMFGKGNSLASSGRVASVQSISGTGANHLGALLLATNIQPNPKVFVGVPSWGNTVPLFKQVGLEVETYRHVDPATKQVDFETCLRTIREAPAKSIFSLQGCCQNPVGADFSPEQWNILAAELKAREHLPFIDIAYQGLGDGLNEDAAGVHIVTETCPEVIVCQSFSKNFALYGERCGALHVVAKTPETAANVKDQLRVLIRQEFSSSPAFGSRLVKIVLSDAELRQKWIAELSEMRARLHRNRAILHEYLTKTLSTPGNWDHIITDKGLFSTLALSADQCEDLTAKYHIHLPASGRINVAGLNAKNLAYTAEAIDAVVRKATPNGSA
ncbi:hypothetical protein KJ359_001171 [Pestalotiopsis sp. 9143b]|nr:hypothetical protein KJ359_001171 [Pestalotiopsis sp. 9143b]